MSTPVRPASDVRTRLRLQAEKFMWDAFWANEPESPARSRRLARFADRMNGREVTERYIIGLRAWDATLRGEPAGTALRHAQRVLDKGGLSWTDETRGFEVPVLVAMVFMYADRPGRAEELFAAGIAEFEREGWRGAHLSFGYTLLGYIRFRRGRLVEAEDFARHGLRLAERVGPRTPVHWYAVAVSVEVLLARGRVEEAAELAERYDFGEPFPAAVVFPDVQGVYGELLLACGDHRAAAAQLAGAGRRLDTRGMRNPAWCPWQLHLAQAEACDPDGAGRERARATALDALRRARNFGTPSAVGMALRVVAEVGTGAERAKLLEEAVTCLEGSPAGYELARALVALGIELRRTGRPEEAAHHLQRGLETAVQCGADGLAEQARSELDTADLRPRRLRTDDMDALTEGEREVAARTARGLGPVEIARELATEEQAVTRLLSDVYRKLGTDREGLGEALAVPDETGRGRHAVRALHGRTGE
jgi:DNA-binding CsgD family transcriptional regulator